MVQERVYECAVWVPGSWMDDHPYRLFHDDQVFVFKVDLKGDVFGRGAHCRGDRDVHFDLIACFELFRRFGAVASSCDVSLRDQLFDERTTVFEFISLY